jgi:hypothetical protein
MIGSAVSTMVTAWMLASICARASVGVEVSVPAVAPAIRLRR